MFNIPLKNYAKVAALPKFDAYNKQIKVAILGGSFNPAHQGHIHISNMVRKKCQLDEVWWLITPQNPIKANKHTAPLQQRYRYAKQLTYKSRYIKVFTSEKFFSNNYTAQTIRHLKNRNPRAKFHWLIGSDNAYHIHKWVGYRQIISQAPIIIFHRPKYITKLGQKPVMKLASTVIVTGKLHPLSSSAIRKNHGNTNPL